MISFKINNKDYQFPTHWDEVTAGQYIQLLNTTEIRDTASIFTGITAKTLRNSQIIGLERLISTLSFLNKAPDFVVVSKKIGKYELPNDITMESLAQFEDLSSMFKKLPAKELKNYTREDSVMVSELYVKACAIYCQKIRDGQYSFKKAMDMVEEIKSYACTEVMPAGSFFLLRPLSLQNGIETNYRKLLIQMKNRKLGLKTWQRCLVWLGQSLVSLGQWVSRKTIT